MTDTHNIVLNSTFDAILLQKSKQIEQLLNKKNDNVSHNTSLQDTTNTLNYSVKTTLFKINAEQDKKLKASKAYKKKEQIFKN